MPDRAYVQPDHLGTPRVVIDPVRDVAIWEWNNKSEVFGNQIPSADPDGDSVAFELALRFPGQQATGASGLFYNYQREYDPAVGRHSRSDSIGLDGGVSTYGYARARPVSNVDALGLQSGAARQLGLQRGQSPLYYPSNEGYYHPDLGYVAPDQGPMLYPGDFLAPGLIALETLFPAIPVGISIVANKEPKDARDPSGAKAPGLPGQPEGYCPGKDGPECAKRQRVWVGGQCR